MKFKGCEIGTNCVKHCFVILSSIVSVPLSPAGVDRGHHPAVLLYLSHCLPQVLTEDITLRFYCICLIVSRRC